MKANEHRAIGDEATGGATVEVSDGLSSEPLRLRHGDVIALSGDFFLTDLTHEGRASSRLFDGTTDEILCALKVMAVDEGVPDPRFEWGGEYADREFDADLERRVRDRFLALAAVNTDHFLAPWSGEGDAGAGGGAGAASTYRRLHQVALDQACQSGRHGGDLGRAMAREAAAQHYLTDAFAAGHVRTPIASIRRFWLDRYPRFWESLQRKVAADTAAALRELARPLRLLPSRQVHDRTLVAVRLRTASYPAVSLGDLLGRVFHDWDNDHGLVLEDGQELYGDGHLDQGVGGKLAVAAVRAGNDDVEVAFRLGRCGSRLTGQPLYQRVREARGVHGPAFPAERHLPRLAPENPPLNWRARDIEELWRSPIAGSAGPTVGEVVAQTLQPDGEVARRLDCLAHGVVEGFGVLDLPLLRGWLGRKACQAYHHGFIAGLANNPLGCLTTVVADAGGPGDRERARRPHLAAVSAA